MFQRHGNLGRAKLQLVRLINIPITIIHHEIFEEENYHTQKKKTCKLPHSAIVVHVHVSQHWWDFTRIDEKKNCLKSYIVQDRILSMALDVMYTV